MMRKLLAFAMALLILLNIFGVVVSASPVSVEEPNPNTANWQSGVPEAGSMSQSSALASGNSTGQSGKKNVVDSQSLNDSDKRNSVEPSVWNTSFFLEGDHGIFVVGLHRERTDGYSKLEGVVTRNRGTIINSISLNREVIAAVVRVPTETISTFLVQTRDNDLSEYIEPNLKFQTQFTPKDPYWNMQWGPAKIGADWAWNTTTGSHSILVAVVDTGIYYSHEDLAANYVPLGYDWVNNDPDPTDDYGHGTHVAGTIAAALNNSIGVAGLGNVRIMAEKGLDEYGFGTEDVLAKAIIHAVDQGANVISMSWGGTGNSKLIYDAIRYAYDKGVLLVAAAGNSGSSTRLYPAAYDEVIAVTATDRDDSMAWFSSFGDWVELAAPGVDIYSTVPWGYASASGTSMAAPHVSGLAALVWSKFPNKTRDWVRMWLRYTALDLGSLGFDVNYGYGRIDARKAIEQAPPELDLIVSSGKAPHFVEPGSKAGINATVLNFGARSQNDTLVQLFANSSLVDSTLINFIPSGGSSHVSLNWSPIVEGRYNITVYVVPSAGETVIENNRLQISISVGFPLKVFVLNSAGTMVTDAWDSLNSEWALFGNKLIFIDYKTLDKENISYEDLVASDADVLIISCAYSSAYGWQFTDAEIDAIKQYVFEGHGLIATAGTFFFDVPNNNKLASLFGINETIIWDSTLTDLQHIKDPAHPIFKNIPNPFIFPYSGTALPSDGRWSANELAGGTYLAKGHFEENAIVAYRGLVYISTWMEILPDYYFFPLQILYNAITWTQYQKPAHDLAAFLRTPRFVKPGESAVVNATVVNKGLSNETNVELSLLIDDVVVNTATIPELQTGSSFTINYTWTPTVERGYNLTAYVKPLPNEESLENNVNAKIIFVHFPVFVLWDDTKDLDGDELFGNYFPLYQLLTERGYIIDELDTGPINASIIAGYDVFVLMDPELDFSSSEITGIQQWVDGGGALLIVPDGGYPASIDSLMMPYGVRMTGWAGGFGSTSDIVKHPITEGVNSIFVNAVREIQVASPSVSLAWTTDYVRMAFLSATEGPRVVVASDSNIMDNSGLGMDDNTQLMLNIFAWLSTKPEHELSVSLDSPFFIEPGNSTILNATVRNLGLKDEANIELQLLINGTAISSVIIPELIAKSNHTLHQLWAPTVLGIYNVTAYAPPLPQEQTFTNNVASVRVRVSHAFGRVAVLDSTEDPWYFVGSINNDYQVLVDGLNSQGFYALGVTNDQIANGILSTFDLFVMVDNIPSDAAASYVVDFWSKGGGIIAFDSSICFLNHFGILPPEAVPGNGHGLYWDYGTGPAGKISKNHPVTAGYDINQIVYGTAGDAEYFVDYLAITSAFPYYSMLVQDVNKDNRAYVSAYEPPAAGRTVHIWDQQHWRNSALQLMILNAVEWVKKPIRDVAIVNAIPSTSSIIEGDTLGIDVVVQNRGNVTETFTVTARALSLNSTRIYLEPSDYLFDAATVNVGYEFNVTVKVHDVKDLASWQVRINFNDSIINPTRWFEPVWNLSYVFYGRGTFAVPPPPQILYYHWGPGSGSVQAGSMILPMQTGTGFNGDGLVAIFEFEIIAIPSTSETYSSVLMIDNPDTNLLDSNVDEIPTSKKDGYYSLGWGGSPPPPEPPDFYIIGTKTVTKLAPRANVTLVFLWDTGGVFPRYYRIIAETSEVPNEIDITNNIYADGTIRIMKAPKADFSYTPLFAKAGEAVTFDASNSSPNGGVIVNYTWDFGDSNVTSTTGPVVTHAYSTSGYYNVTLTIRDNEALEASTSKAIYVFYRDVAVVEVAPSTNQTYIGRIIDINITIKNKGEVTENFTLILYCSIIDEGMNRQQSSESMIPGSIIETKDITNMLPGESRTLVFHWNTIGVGSNRYLLTGLATPVFGETHTADNTKPSTGPVRVKIVGDVNGDDKVDIKDLAIAAKSYGSNIGYPTWSPDADLNDDGRIDIRDVVIIARNFGRVV